MVDITRIDRLVQSSPHPAWLATGKGDCLYANPALERLTGLSSDQINQADWRSFLWDEDRAAAAASWQRSLATGTPYRMRVRLRGFDGVPATIELIAFGHNGGDGTELWFFTGLRVDSATEQPPLETQLQATLNVIPGYTWYAAPSGALTFVNERLADYLGLPKDHPLRFGIEIGGAWDSHIPLLHPDDHEESRRVWSTCLRAGSAGEVSFRVRNAEGGYRWFLSRVEPLRASDGTLLYWIGVNLEIEERKQAEFYLAEGERLAHMGSWVFNPAGFFSYWSRELFHMYGLDPAKEAPSLEEYLARIHPDDREFMRSLITQMVAEASGCDVTKRILRPNGELRYIRCVGTPVVENAALQRIVGTAIDVTDHELLTQELRTREAYLAEAQRLSHTGSFGWKPDSGEVVWTDETYRIFEYDLAEKPSLNMVFQRIHPEDRALAQKVIEGASRSGADFEHGYRLLMPSGTIKHIHVRAHAVHDSSGNNEFIGAVTDISERKRAEQKVREQEVELRSSEAYLAEAQRLSQTGSWAWNPVSDTRYYSEECYRLLGFEPHGPPPPLETVIQRIHPDDQAYCRERVEKGVRDKVDFELDYRIVHPDKGVRDIHCVCHAVLDRSGDLVELIGTVIDFTERKRAEDDLRQAFDEIKKLQDQLYKENLALRDEVDRASMFEEVVGTSKPLQAVLSRIAKVAPTESTVLITGETGTGKELIARAVHKRSQRSGRAFVSVNCAAIPRDLIASELFGHEKGAFTGATQRRLGRFELADGGTIFLDEVGELSPDTQVALLRVLQEREFERVGGGQHIPVDVRVIAATNRDLKADIANGTFRQDLFYRLNVFPIEVPPLRERKDDILMLVEYFVQRYATKAGKHIRSIDKKTLDLLRSYAWPGNIRELQNVIERSVILSSGELFSVDELWLSKETTPPVAQVEARAHLKREVEQRSEREIIEAALAETRGRVSGPSGAAAKLGIPPSTLDHRIKALKINKSHFKFR